MNSKFEDFNWLNFLIGLNIFIYIIFVFVGATDNIDKIILYGALNPILVEIGLVWTLITSNFVHFEVWHIAMNMLALYQIGLIVKTYYSEKLVFSLYVISGLAAGIFSYFYSFIDPFGISIGASGSVFGLLGFLISVAIMKDRRGDPSPFRFESFYPTIILGILISFIPGVNWAAHLGGFLAGAVMGLFIEDISHKFMRFENFVFRLSLFLFVVSFALLILNIFFDFFKIVV